MKLRFARIFLLLLLGNAWVAFSARAQTPAARQEVTVTVVNALPQPAQPVQAADVALWSQDIALQQKPTNSNGQALLEVSAAAAQGGDLRIEIQHAGNLVIYLPASGELDVSSGLPTKVTIRLLPKGSPALLEPAQIQAMLRRMSIEISALRRQNSTLRGQTGTAEPQQKPDLGAAIADWAQTNGFSSAQVDQQVQQWANGIENQSGAATAEQKALAEMALQHYGAAAQLFNQASAADQQQLTAEDSQEQALEQQMKALHAAQQKLLDTERASLRALLDHSQQAATAEQLNLQYHEATQTLESAEVTAQAQFKKHPDDKGFHELWLLADWYVAYRRMQEAEVGPADQSLSLLAQSAGAYQLLAREYAESGDLQNAASAQLGLGLALMDEGERASSQKATILLDQSVQAFRSALQVYTRANLPRAWARTENDLSIALIDESARAGNQKTAEALVEEAVQVCRTVLQTDSRADFPQEWAETEVNLGVALRSEGDRATLDKAPGLVDQAAAAFRSALEIYTKADLPRLWAGAESLLGVALWDEGTKSTGAQKLAMFNQSIQAYRNALQVYTQAALPQNWAGTEADLGVVLVAESENTSGEKAMMLLQQGLAAYRSALLVYTPTALPQNWARTESNLGNANYDEAQQATGDRSLPLFDQAAAAYQSTLSVYTQVTLPQDWAMTETNLGTVLRAEGERVKGDQSMTLLSQAAAAYRNALQVFTRADRSEAWLLTECELGVTLEDEGLRARGDQATGYFNQAIQAYDEVLGLYPGWVYVLHAASHLDHEVLFRYDETLTFDERLAVIDTSPLNRLTLMEAALTAGKFDACIQQTGALADKALPSSEVADGKAIEFACQWGAGNKTAAHATDVSLSQQAAALKPGVWTFTGTLHFLAASPTFASRRASWIALFTAVQNGDAAGATTALHQLDPILQQ